MEKSTLIKIILKYKKSIPKEICKREVKVRILDLDKAIVVVGPRRAGKTYLLYDLINEHNEDDWIFLNFEDNDLDNIKKEELPEILELAKELIPETKILHLFFDEIQSAPIWEKFVVSLLNQHQKIILSGSNSRFLSKEIATSLRGKTIAYLLLPFSFREYLKIKKIKLEKNYGYIDKAIEIKREFDEFIRDGGFPEIILAKEKDLRNRIINNYFDSVLYKDLVERLRIKNFGLVEITLKYLLNNFGNTFAISAFENYLKSNKIPYSLEDLYLILRAAEDVFFICYVKEYSKSFKKSEISKSKTYLFDTGYIRYLARESNDFGRILENLVFIELFRRQDEIENKGIFYFRTKNTKECDFVVDKKGKLELFQVTYELTDQNKDREIQGLLEAMQQLNVKNGTILTRDQTKSLEIEGYKIEVKPVWLWLLNY